MVIFRFHVELQGSKKRFRFWIKAWKRSLEMEMDQVWWDSLWGWTSIRISFCIRSSIFDDFAVKTGVFKEGLTMVWAIAKPANFEELRSSSFVFLALISTGSSFILKNLGTDGNNHDPWAIFGIDVHPQNLGCDYGHNPNNTGVYPMYCITGWIIINHDFSSHAKALEDGHGWTFLWYLRIRHTHTHTHTLHTRPWLHSNWVFNSFS